MIPVYCLYFRAPPEVAPAAGSMARAAPSPPPPPPPPTAIEAGKPEQSVPPNRLTVTLLQPSQRKHNGAKHTKFFRTFRAAIRSFPILAPIGCRIASASLNRRPGSRSDGHVHGATRITGTLFGHRKARITIAFQDNPRSIPHFLLELSVPTAKFMQDMGSAGLIRVALECEKRADSSVGKSRVLDEPIWSAFINGRNVGFAARRDPSEKDLSVMQLLHAVSMGAGVLPSDMSDPADGELTYMRAFFDRMVGSKDSETFYMLNPDGNAGPELSIFFVRI